MAEAAERYWRSVGPNAHPLPAQFRWADCYRAMLAAHPSAPSQTQAVAGERLTIACGLLRAALKVMPNGKAWGDRGLVLRIKRFLLDDAALSIPPAQQQEQPDQSIGHQGRFRKKPVVVEAWRLTSPDTQGFDVPYWLLGAIAGGTVRPEADNVAGACAFIDPLEGTMRADVGDWIIKGVKGEIYSCKPDIFAATYEPADSGQQGSAAPSSFSSSQDASLEARGQSPGSHSREGE
jgi:hypothetical protein